MILEQLLEPLSPAAFCAEYWGRRSVVIRGGADKLDRVFGAALDRPGFLRLAQALARQELDIRRLNEERGLDVGLPWRATFDQSAFLDGRGANPFVQIRPEQVGALYAGGASIQLAAIESLVFGDADEARIARAAEAIRAELHHPAPVLVGATLSPPGAGFGPHFDPTGAFLIQTAGRKRYSFGREPLVPYPRAKAYLTSAGTLRYRTVHGKAAETWELPTTIPSPWHDETVELGPGDILYIPPGALHATEAGDDEPSVALLVIFSQVNPRGLISALIQELLGADPRWRHVPAFVADDNALGRLPPHVTGFLHERLGEVVRVLGELRGDGFELAQLWQRLGSDDVTLPRAASPRGELGADDVLEVPAWVRTHVAAGTRSDGTFGASLFRGATEVSVDGAWGQFLVTLSGQTRFVARDAHAWAPDASWDEVRACLADLVATGFLVHA